MFAATVQGTMSMSCSSIDSERFCSEAKLAVDGKTHIALFTALSASEVDTTDASTSARDSAKVTVQNGWSVPVAQPHSDLGPNQLCWLCVGFCASLSADLGRR